MNIAHGLFIAEFRESNEANILEFILEFILGSWNSDEGVNALAKLSEHGKVSIFLS